MDALALGLHVEHGLEAQPQCAELEEGADEQSRQHQGCQVVGTDAGAAAAEAADGRANGVADVGFVHPAYSPRL